MQEPTSPGPGPPPSSAPRSAVRTARWLRRSCLVAANLVGTVAAFTWLRPNWPVGTACLLLALALVALAYRWKLTRDRVLLGTWVGLSIAIAFYSILTGWHNGLTDEPFVTPAFAQLWPNLYGSSISLTYQQYGLTHTLTDLYNVYMPGLAFVEIPGINYKWTALAAWLAGLYLLRRRGAAVLLWGGVWVGLAASSGFNDFVPLLTLTLAYVTLAGVPSRLAEFVSLGLKQFANVVVVAVHLYRRQWRDALIASVITAAILVPFALLSPEGVVCHVLLLQPHACTGAANADVEIRVFGHLNYFLWPLWLVAVFGPGYLLSLRTAGPGGVRGWIGAAVRRWSGPEGDGAPSPTPGGRADPLPTRSHDERGT